jgi:uncharacterized protein (TIGR00255 family)
MKSMTGFGSATRRFRGFTLTCEARSVNHRFFSLRCSLPEGWSGFEPLIERAAREVIRRGSLNVTLMFEPEASAAGPRVDLQRLRLLKNELARAKRALGYGEPLSFEWLMNLPAAWPQAGTNGAGSATWDQTRPVILKALRHLGAMRAKEGQGQREELAMRVSSVREIAGRIAAKAPTLVENYRQKLVDRLLRLSPESERNAATDQLFKEIVSLVERCDISEEVQRLSHHVEQFEKLLRSADPVGRRLDFLNQEMLRETNTIASKAAETAVIDDTIAIKAELERIKEQVENVE